MKRQWIRAGVRDEFQLATKFAGYQSGDNLRALLGLPDDTAEVMPGDHGNWRIFIQSKSTNRKLYPGTAVLVMKQ